MSAVRLAPASLEHTDRERWLALRREGLGGSDAPCVMGMDDSRSPWQVWVEKVTGRSRQFTEEQQEAMDWGHEVEALIARRWARRHAIPGRMARCGMLADTRRPWLRVNLDRRVSNCGLGRGPCILECKHRTAWQSARWSRTGDAEQVPDGPAIQVQHGLLITGYSHGHLLAQIGHQLREYLIPADPRLQKIMAEELGDFWHGHVVPRVPPPVDASEESGRILARMFEPAAGAVMLATPDLDMRQGMMRLHAEQAQHHAEIARRHANEIRQAMGTAEVLADPETGAPLVTWKRNGNFRASDFAADWPQVAGTYSRSATRIDTDALAAADPDLYGRYRARVFRVVPLKDTEET